MEIGLKIKDNFQRKCWGGHNQGNYKQVDGLILTYVLSKCIAFTLINDVYFVKQPVYFYNERIWFKEEKKASFSWKIVFLHKNHSLQVLGGSACWTCWVALGGKTIEEEGVCCFSSGWVGWMGEKETKAKGYCAER